MPCTRSAAHRGRGTSHGIALPYTAQAAQIVRRTRPVNARTGKAGQWRTETVYAITDLAHTKPTRQARRVGPRAVADRERPAAGPRRYLRRGPIPGAAPTPPQVMASLRNLVISLHRLAGVPNIAAALRHHARDALRPLQLLKII